MINTNFRDPQTILATTLVTVVTITSIVVGVLTGLHRLPEEYFAVPGSVGGGLLLMLALAYCKKGPTPPPTQLDNPEQYPGTNHQQPE